MIVFDLRCVHGHGFEGWFASSKEFARQKEAGLVRCPVCDVPGVERLPSARVRVKKGAAPAAATPPPTAAAATDIVAGLPAELIAKLREAVRNTEDVGERFPEEARRIHYKETPARSIRGKASREDAEALTEEGIEFAQLPPFLTRDSH
ncbi:MAG: DUF1178 family protein [Burkholderiales bacterium]|nr:DUF1178 family protein [Burkholderiales bacterium]